MAVQKRRVALVGLGMVVGAHVRSLNDLADRVEIAYAYSPTAARREAFAAQFLVPTCDRLETILDDPSIDAVIVLTPPNTHLDIVGRCAAAGKHVLLEKPLEITTERATQMVAACEAAGVTLGIVLQHRFRPAAEALARMLAAGDLGEIAGCSTIIRLWRPQAYYDEPGRGSLARCPRHHRRDDRRLSGLSRAHRVHLPQRDRGPRRDRPRRHVPRRPHRAGRTAGDRRRHRGQSDGFPA